MNLHANDKTEITSKLGQKKS